MRLIRVMCSGRVDLEFILRAFAKGQDGVFIGGCRLDECNYTTHGNYDALATTMIGRKILERIGIDPHRLRIDFMSGADGNLLAGGVDEFTMEIKALGPIGKSENIEPDALALKLDAARKLVPYIKLVERERLRLPEKKRDTYEAFFRSPTFERLFDELIGDHLTMSQIMLFLGKTPRSTTEISTLLGLSPSEVSRHMKQSSRQGLVRYDEAQKCYAPA